MADSTIPSPAQLALALAIVKQKPIETTMKDYFTHIRQFIKSVPPTDRPTNRDQYFDSVAFWQKAYERSEAEQSKLLDRIYELEQRNEVLSAKLQGPNAAKNDIANEAMKRKATLDDNAAGSAGSRKKSKMQTQSQGRTTNLTDYISGGLGDHLPEYVEEPTASFMRRFYTLQKASQRCTNISAVVLAAAELCSIAIEDIVRAVQQQSELWSEGKDAPPVQRPSIAVILKSIYCAYGLLLKALKKIPVNESTLQGRGQITFHIVRLYETVIQALGSYCQDRVQHQMSTGVSASKAKPAARKDTSTEDEVAAHLSLLISNMTSSLDRGCTKTSDLRDGFSFVLLNRVGQLLCLFVFKDLHQRSDLHVDPASLSLPPGLKDMQLGGASILAAGLEAKHLIPPLERLVVIVDPPLSSTRPDSDLGHAAGIRETLQNTLLQAVFGGSSIVGEALRPLRHNTEDDALNSILNRVKVPEPSAPEWFVQEVWSLLGWNLVVGR
ncbi:uncharacterized protein BO97DRAFT_432820 [Aspergillus homomorphus CBS 101889]|uniref:Uncharacterized protein n=1 Tax=Aspergillus homomorphus (strain CBS 101889) TaxID=1450537 RepID=A0A395I380_ASPHC|nr:hypothetical protein BO97DRAFT_432820 [Aspergillus homomorphus CBS 101889]RAL14652.1 hypothetical protein BO97DRAFT_432820 [Aspergillus homomorphus CBS 101889]